MNIVYEVKSMAVKYDKLWDILADRKMKKKDLLQLTGLSPTTMAKLGRNEVVKIEVLMRICGALECNLGDVIDLVNVDQVEVGRGTAN